MVFYNCSICGYNTIRKNQYQRHLNTKKHLQNIESNNKKNLDINCNQIVFNCPYCDITFNDNNLLFSHLTSSHMCELTGNQKSSFIDNTMMVSDENITQFVVNPTKVVKNKVVTQSNTKVTQSNIKVTQQVTQEYICEFCNKKFKYSNSYYRHLKHYCKNKQNNSNCTENQEFMFSIVDKILEHTNDYNEKLLKEKDKSKYELLAEKEKNNELMLKLIDKNNCINSNNNIINQNNTLNNSNYVIQFFNYSDADSMDNIKDKFKLTREEFIKASLTNGYRGALLEKAENIIIKPYIKSQYKRPMHTVDSSRKKALYKDETHTKWTFHPKTTLDHCFEMFHKSALEHQDITIKENPNWVLDSIDDSLYKQTYFIPTENKVKETIYKEVQNHIYKETKVNRKDIMDNINSENLLEFINDFN